MQKIIIYSHGFGVDKTSRGLFTDVANVLPDYEHIMFSFNKHDAENNTTIVSSLFDESKILNEMIEKTKKANPNAVIDLICHSQGCIAAALAKPTGINKVLMLAPGAKYNNDGLISTFSKRPGTIVDLDGLTILPRADGSTTIVTADYWKSKSGLDPVRYYNELSKLTNLIMIRANQDELMAEDNFSGLDSSVRVLNIDGDHNFKGSFRAGLVKVVIDALS